MNYLKTTFFILSLFLSINFFAQKKAIDSLKNELAIHKYKDTTRVNILNELAFLYFMSDIPKSLKYIAEAHTLSEATHYKKGKARSIYIKGITEAIQSNYEQALLHYNDALKLYESISLKKGIADSYNAMAISYKNKGELRTATTYLKKSIEINEEIRSNNLSASLLNLGTTYVDLGDFDKAIVYLEKAMSIATVEKNEHRIAYSLNNLGTIYNLQGNYQLALDHFNKSLSIHKNLGDSISIAHNLSNIASIYKLQKYSKKAITHYEQSLGIYKRINNKHRVSSTLNGIGAIYEDIGDYQIALNYYFDALRIGKEVGANSETPFILNNIGNIYFAYENYDKSNLYFKEGKKVSLENGNKETLCGAYVGLAKINLQQKNYNIALNNTLKAKRISEESGFLNLQKEVSEVLFKIYKAIGKYKDALENHQKFKILNDSLFNKKNIEKIAQLESEYKYKQELVSAQIRELQLADTLEIASKNLEKSKRNLLLGVILFLIVALVLVAIIFFLKLRNAKTKTQNIIIEQKLLRSQMTPHFIFNSLSVLQGMILNKEEENSISYLSKFSKLLRTVLENSRHKKVLLTDELKAIESFMALQNLDATPPYKYSLKVDSEINKNTIKIPPMLIQPFIENAIEHAFPNKRNSKEINVELIFKDKKLFCTIEDNGIGINTDTKNNKNKNSLATTITSERLKMLSKDFNVQGSLSIKNRK